MRQDIYHGIKCPHFCAVFPWTFHSWALLAFTSVYGCENTSTLYNVPSFQLFPFLAIFFSNLCKKFSLGSSTRGRYCCYSGHRDIWMQKYINLVQGTFIPTVSFSCDYIFLKFVCAACARIFHAWALLLSWFNPMCELNAPRQMPSM